MARNIMKQKLGLNGSKSEGSMTFPEKSGTYKSKMMAAPSRHADWSGKSTSGKQNGK